METKTNTSMGSKILTVAFCILLVALTIFAFVYLLTGPDFMSPKQYQELYGTEATEPSQGPIDYDALLYEATMQDMFDYLTEKGYIDQNNKIPMSIIGTDNWICDGLDMMWWDVDNLVEGTEPYTNWYHYQENGFILFGSSIYAPTLYGPFGLYVLPDFAGDPNQLDADMKVFGQWLYAKYGGGEVDLTAEYEKALDAANMQDLLDYLDELGHIKQEEKVKLIIVGTENWRYNDVDMLWWDLDNMQEGTEEYKNWQEITENGFLVYPGGYIYSVIRNGPFALWIGPEFTGDPEQLEADFANFGKWLYERNSAQ